MTMKYRKRVLIRGPFRSSDPLSFEIAYLRGADPYNTAEQSFVTGSRSGTIELHVAEEPIAQRRFES